MARSPKRSNLAANAACDAMAALADSGRLRIYGGVKPADADTVVAGQVLLAELTMNAPAFAAAGFGVATAYGITSDPSAAATGTASWFRLTRSNGTTVCDGSVGIEGADLNLDSVAIRAGAAVAVTSFSLTESKG